MARITLGYWKMRGIAQPIRLLLGYKKVNFVDEIYELGDAPDYDNSCWMDLKYKCGLCFPNLPYLIDGNVKITQCNAIMAYLGRKFQMDGETEKEKIRIDMIMNQAADLRNAFITLAYRSNVDNFEGKSERYKKKLHTNLGLYNNFLGNDHTWFAGEKLTIADFMMYEYFDQHRLFDERLFDSFKRLQEFMQEFEELPEMKEFLPSEECFKGDIFGKMALIR